MRPLALLAIGCVMPVPAQATQILGTAKTAEGRPIVGAKIIVRPGAGVAGATPINRTLLNGRIDVTVPSSWPTFTVTISAKGYLDRKLTMVADRPVIRLGDVKLALAPGVRLMNPDLYSSGSDSNLRVVLKNIATQQIVVNSIGLRGVRKKRTDCYDLKTPEVVVDLANSIALSASGAAGKVDFTVGAPGQTGMGSSAAVRFGPCEQGSIDLKLPLVLKLSGGEDVMLEVRLPRRVGGGADQKSLDVAQWDALVFATSWTASDGSSPGSYELKVK